MVKVSTFENKVKFEVLGSHKFWAFRSEVIVNHENIVQVKKAEFSWWSWIGWRVPGTALPYVIYAGTYYKNKEKHFWDVSNKDKVVEIELKNEEFQKLFIEVENVEEAILLLKS